MIRLNFTLPIVLGIALASATGFRVFLPMLIVSAAVYTGHLSLDNSFAWLGTRWPCSAWRPSRKSQLTTSLL